MQGAVCVLIKQIQNFYNEHGKKPIYFLPYIIFLLFSFGYSLTRNTLSIDDLAGQYYSGSFAGAMVEQGRWEDVLYNFLINCTDFSQYIYKFAATVVLAFVGFLFAALLYSFNDNKKKIPTQSYMLISSLFITCPFIFEFWKFTGTDFIVACNMLIVLVSFLHLAYGRRKYVWKILITGIVLSIVASSYESVLVLYISIVLFYLFYKYCINSEQQKNKFEWIKVGTKFIPPIVIAVILRFVIGFILMAVFSVEKTETATNTMFLWDSNISECVSSFLSIFTYNYLFNLQYLPILVFFVSVILFIVATVYSSIKNNKILPILLGALCLISLFLIPIATLNSLTLSYRMQQPVLMFVPFSMFVFSNMFIGKKHIFKSLLFVLLIASVFQSTCMSRMFELANIRSENESAVINYIGSEIKNKYPHKKVVVAGEYHFSEYLNDRIKHEKSDWDITTKLFRQTALDGGIGEWSIPQDFESVINWANGSQYIFDEKNMLQTLFSYYGYDLDVINIKNVDEFYSYEAIAKENNMSEMQIKNVGDYILVYLGEITNPQLYFY